MFTVHMVQWHVHNFINYFSLFSANFELQNLLLVEAISQFRNF